MLKNLVLGTAQLGSNYGINNHHGQPSLEQAQAIIREAWDQGIVELDTAQAYGTSEAIIGQVLRQLQLTQQVRVISKIDPKIDHQQKDILINAVDASLKRLGVHQLFGLMLHDENGLDFWEDNLGKNLNTVVSMGKVQMLGVSVYKPERAIEALQKEGISFIQVPANLLDRRIDNAGVFALARKLGKTVYVRSVFLQGLLLMTEAQLPSSMAFAADIIKQMGQLAAGSGLTRRELALGYARRKWPEARVVIGVETVDQLRENVRLWGQPLDEPLCRDIESYFNDVGEKILNPSLWPK